MLNKIVSLIGNGNETYRNSWSFVQRKIITATAIIIPQIHIVELALGLLNLRPSFTAILVNIEALLCVSWADPTALGTVKQTQVHHKRILA